VTNLAKIAIVGRGIAGLTLAYRLVKRGYQPIIYGRKDFSQRASSAAQGVVCNKGLVWPRQPMFQAKIRSLLWVKNWLEDIARTTGCLINHSFSGVFEPYLDRHDFHRIFKRVYKGQFTGCFGSKNLVANSLPWEESASPAFAGTLFYPGDGWFDPQQLMVILEEYCLSNGASICEDQVVALESANCRPALVTTTGEQNVFDKLVIAGGQGSERLLHSLGCNDIDFFYHPGQVLLIKNAGWQKQWAMVRKTYSLVSRSGFGYLGATTDKLSSSDEAWQPEERHHLWEILQDEFGLADWQLKNFEVEDLWGVRVRVGDRLPIVGCLSKLRRNEQEWSQFYLMTGFYKNGLQLADMAASWLEREMFTGEIDSLARAFHPARFQKA